jgi:hypothetical protein
MFKQTVRRFRLPLIAGALSLVLSMGVLVAWSLWSNSAKALGGGLNGATGLVNGDFNEPESLWRRSTVGFTEFHAADLPAYSQPSGTVTPGLVANPITMPGDSIEFTMPVTASVAGTNLAAGFTVHLSDPEPSAATWDNVSGRWNDDGQLALEFYVAQPVDDGAGGSTLQRVAPPIGQPLAVADQVLTLPDLVPGSDTVETPYVVVARVTVLGDYNWASDFTSTASPQGWSPGELGFELVQLRGASN